MSNLRKLAALIKGPQLHLLPRGSDEPRSRRARDPRWGALMGLLVVLLLVLGGLFLIHVLARAGRLQDCVMSGRTNCAPVDPGSNG